MSEDIRVNDVIDFVDTVLNLSDKQFDTFLQKGKRRNAG